jgi:predicted SprT family Zn-dependent metalloprotease
VTPSDGAKATIHALLRDWGRRWGLPGFEQTVRGEWSRRFRRSLGRVHLDRRVIRLSAELREASRTRLSEVLCHEAAHLAARDLHGACRAHGPEWAALMRAVGFEPRPRIPRPVPAVSSPRAAPRRRRYIHRCPVCHRYRIAGRPVRRWRCVACVAAGLAGRLEISALPARQA